MDRKVRLELVSGKPRDKYSRLLAYVFLAGMVNRSIIRLDAKRLAARHGPIPLNVGAGVGTDRIESFFVEAREKRAAYSRRTYYYFIARLKGSAKAEVLKNVNELERAASVQRALADGLARVREQIARQGSDGPESAGP